MGDGVRRGSVWRGVAWRGVVAWRAAVWHGVEWSGVAWRGVGCCRKHRHWLQVFGFITLLKFVYGLPSET
jgi:hypothetical protein